MLSSALMFSRNESSSIILTLSFLSFSFLKSGKIFLKSNSTLEILLIKILGIDDAEGAINIWKKMIEVLEKGEHRPGHFYAEKRT